MSQPSRNRVKKPQLHLGGAATYGIMWLHKMAGYRNVLRNFKGYSAAGIPEKIKVLGKQ